MTQAVQLYNNVSNPFESAMAIGPSFAKSGLFGVDRAEAGTILALACIAENQSPFQILRTYDICMGKLRKKSLACYAEFRAKGGRCKWINTGDDGKEAVGEFTFEGQTQLVRFSIEDARKQGLVKRDSAWEKTPGNMLRARVISNAIGMLCPEIVAGVTDGDDGETPAVEPKPILQRQPEAKAEPKTEPKAAAIIDVEPAKPTETATAPAPAPTPEPPVEFVPPPGAPVERLIAKADGKTGKLTPETVAAIIDIVGGGETEQLAFKWLENKKWILPMGGIGDLSVARAQKILDKPLEWLEQVKASAPKA